MKPENIQELKEKLYLQVDQLQDATVLHMLQESITAYSSAPVKDITDELTEGQQERLQQSIQQAEEGKTFTHEEVKRITRKWLSQ